MFFVMKLDVVELHISDWKKSLDWWVNKLGLKIVVREDKDKFALLIGTDGAMVGLYGGQSSDKHGFIPFFKVSDIEKEAVRLQRKSVHVDKVEQRHWGKQMKITDIEGNIFCLYQEKRNF